MNRYCANSDKRTYVPGLRDEEGNQIARPECLEKNNPTLTNYEVLGYYKYWSDNLKRTFSLTKVRVKLLTGKTHQIRVHMNLLAKQIQKANVPGLVGDTRYTHGKGAEGGSANAEDEQSGKTHKKADSEFCPRLFLHCRSLGFRNIDSEEREAITSTLELPEALQNALSKCTADVSRNNQLAAQIKKEREMSPIMAFTIDFGVTRSVEQKLTRLLDDKDIIEFIGV